MTQFVVDRAIRRSPCRAVPWSLATPTTPGLAGFLVAELGDVYVGTALADAM